MTTLTQRLGLKRHTTGDRFRIADYVDNWLVLDAAPGRHICTSATHPVTWDAAHIGRGIRETDTGLDWRWNGTVFVRESPKGDLGSADVVANAATASTAPVVAITTNVTVPAGDRPVMVHLSGPGVYSTVGLTRLYLFRGATQIQSWLSHGRLTGTADDQPRAISMSIRDTPGVGAQAYTLQFSAEAGYGGTSTLIAAAGTPLRLSVVEI